MTPAVRKYVWLGAAIVSGSILLDAAVSISSGDTSKALQLSISFAAFAISAVGAAYNWNRMTDFSRRQRELLDTEKAKLTEEDSGKVKED